MTLERLELYRGRWRRARQTLHLDDPEAPAFGTGGLVRYAPTVWTRLVILPSDPDGSQITFDEPFWEWWETNHPDPATGRPALWGLVSRPTSTGAARCMDYGEGWERYLALHRHGGLEVGLGTDGAVERAERRRFRLIPIVGRVWAALVLYADIIARFQLSGPWEVTLALRETSGAFLGDFGSGWLEPGQEFNTPAQCTEPNLMRHWELSEWPDVEHVRSVAFSAGDWLENAWGSRQRRYLARQGPLAGQFDTDRYRW